MIKKTQGSLEYIIIIGGVIILAAATYFMLRGFAETTGEGATETIEVAGDKFRLDLENLGRSETRFRARGWGSFPQVSKLTVNTTGPVTIADITLNNLTEYGLNLSEIEFAYNDSGVIERLEYEIEQPSNPDSPVTFTTPTLPAGTPTSPSQTEILLFHNNSSAQELDNVNYSSPNPNVTVEDGTSPEESPDTTPPTIIIFSEAHGTSGSVKDADIKVIVSDEDSAITEVYYSVENSPYFGADNLYYGYEGMALEAHPEDLMYDSNMEIIHIIATVPLEDNYTVRVKALDGYANEKIDTREVSIIVSPGPESDPPVISDLDAVNNTVVDVYVFALNLTTDEPAICKYATSPDIPYDDMEFFSETGSTFHQENITLMDGVNYNYFFKCEDISENVNQTDYTINFTKSGTDSVPPAIIGIEPANNSLFTVSLLTVNLTTNENAECRYSATSGLEFASMDSMNISGYTLHRHNFTLLPGQNYKYYFRCNDSNGNENATDYLLNFSRMGLDTIAPTILSVQPSNNSLVTVSPLTINITTDEVAHCRFSNTSGTNYSLMTDFNSTNSFYHNLTNILLENWQNYTYYLRCNDTAGNVNESDYELNFTASDLTPPVILSTEPANNSVVTESPLTINITTDEIAHCRFSNVSGTLYSSMTDFNDTDSTVHNITDIGLKYGQNYKYYFKCNDTAGNLNDTDYVLNFSTESVDYSWPMFHLNLAHTGTLEHGSQVLIPSAIWPVNIGTWASSSPAIADLDANSSNGLEIVVGGGDNQVYAFHANGSNVSGWPVSLGAYIRSSPAVADLDNNLSNGLEVVIGSNDYNVYAFHANGSNVSGWPIPTGYSVTSSPVIFDLDENPSNGLEVVVSSNDDHVYAFHANNTSVSGWPKTTDDSAVYTSPAAVDLDGNPLNGLEIVIGTKSPDSLYAWHADGSNVPGWPISGTFGRCSPAIADLDANSSNGLEIAISSGYDDVFVFHANNSTLSGWPISLGVYIESSPAVADLDNNLSNGLEVVIGSDDNGLYAWHHNTSNLSGWPKITGGDVDSSPAIAELDGNSSNGLEVVVASGDGNLYVWHSDGSLFN